MNAHKFIVVSSAIQVESGIDLLGCGGREVDLILMSESLSLSHLSKDRIHVGSMSIAVVQETAPSAHSIRDTCECFSI